MKLLMALLFTCSLAQAEEISKVEDITYERLIKLGKETAYTTHIAHFAKLFQLTKVKTFLEFGLGYSTKYFLDSCNKVISVEFVNPGYGSTWMQRCLSLFSEYSNWVPILHHSALSDNFKWAPYKYGGSEWIYKAVAYQTATHKNYAEIDDFYVKELDHFIGQLTKTSTVNVAFVDSGLYLRGDLVQCLFGKVPIIVAHDTGSRFRGEKDDVYGYSRVITPDNYEEIFFLDGPGTTMWVLKNDKNQELIEEMTLYSKSL